MILHIDFETFSTVDLPKVGLDVYTRHPSTDAWCMSYVFGDEEVQLLDIQDELLPERIEEHVKNGGHVVGHNVTFELAVWNNIMVPRRKWPPLKLEQTSCTMAQAYAMALPGKLEKAAAALGINQQKDMAGQRVMLQLAQPRKIVGDHVFWWTEDEFPEKHSQLKKYCVQDTKVERELHSRLLELSPFERKVWEIDQRINNRGVLVDVIAAKKAIEVVEFESTRLNLEMRELTGNRVATCNATSQIKKFIESFGVEVPSIAKSDVLDLLDQDIPEVCKKALFLRQEAAKTSTKKLESMINGGSLDGRIRGLFQYSGANTRRWAGRRVQLQNLPRSKTDQEDIERVFSLLHEEEDPKKIRDIIDLNYGPPLSVISDCIRGFLIAKENHEFAVSDFSNIEGRVLAWLAGEEWKIDAFTGADKGDLPDIYIQAYSRSFRIPLEKVTKENRQIGKVMELALGYQGGVGAFQQMAKNYGIKVPNEKAEEIKLSWREAHPEVVKFWYGLENAASFAVKNPGTKFLAGEKNREVTFLTSGSFLFCKLPSGGVLTYPYPKVETVKTPWGSEKEAVTYMTEDSVTKKWERSKTYGGHFAENVTQSVARDLLAESIVRFEEKGLPVVMHVHDEVVLEVQGVKLKEVTNIMEEVPLWAKGLPIKASGFMGKRFRKD